LIRFVKNKTGEIERDRSRLEDTRPGKDVQTCVYQMYNINHGSASKKKHFEHRSQNMDIHEHEHVALTLDWN